MNTARVDYQSKDIKTQLITIFGFYSTSVPTCCRIVVGDLNQIWSELLPTDDTIAIDINILEYLDEGWEEKGESERERVKSE